VGGRQYWLDGLAVDWQRNRQLVVSIYRDAGVKRGRRCGDAVVLGLAMAAVTVAAMAGAPVERLMPFPSVVERAGGGVRARGGRIVSRRAASERPPPGRMA